MKKLLTTIILAASITIGFAQWQQIPQQRGSGPNNNYPQRSNNYNRSSSLIINTVSQRQLTVYVDNYQYQSNSNNNSINVDQLFAGNHNIIIYEAKRNFWGKTVQQELFNSSLYLRSEFETNIYVNILGQVNISERQLKNNRNYEQDGYGNNGNGVGYGYGRKKKKHKNQHCDIDNDRRYRDDD
jgi:uncharacterized protein YxeA